MIGRPSIRASIAIAALALAVGVAPTLAADPVGSWALKGSFKNTGSSNAKMLKPDGSIGDWASVDVKGTTRQVWYNGGENGAFVLEGLKGRVRRTYTIELVVKTSEISEWNHIIGFGAGDDARGDAYDPANEVYTDTGLYFNSDSLAKYGGDTFYGNVDAGIAVDTWMTIRITRQASPSGPRKVAMFVNGNCIGAFDDQEGFFRFLNGNAAFGVDDSSESYPTWFAGIRIWDTADLPEPCAITPV